MVLNRRYSTHDLVSYDVEWALTRVFDHEIKSNRKLHHLKQDLFNTIGFSAMRAFNELD